MNEITIFYYKKGANFDYDPGLAREMRHLEEVFRGMEISITNQLDVFPAYFFTSHRQKNEGSL